MIAATAVPTLSQWALGLLASLMAWFGIRRPRKAAPRVARYRAAARTL